MMPTGWQLPASLVAAASLVLLLRGCHGDMVTNANNSGRQAVVAIVNDERLRQLEADNAQLRIQRNAAWQAEESLRSERQKIETKIATMAQRNGLFDQPVDADLLCLFNATIELERGETPRDCSAAVMSTATDQPRWSNSAAMVEQSSAER
jgi:hypothetical protein